jgi:hypothetical protein
MIPLTDCDIMASLRSTDGWILKPIDLKRLRKLLRGAIDAAVRKGEVYRRGEWEIGGYLEEAPTISTPSPVIQPQSMEASS